jgi:hypothetical protein
VALARPHRLDHPGNGRATEDDDVQERVRAQAVRPVNRDTGGFADRHQSGDGGFGIVVTQGANLTVPVGRHAAHVVVDGWHHRDRLAKALSEDGRTQEIERLVQERTTEIQGRLNRTLVEKTSTELAVARHVRKEAISDVITRAQSVWSIGDDGQLVATTPDGQRAYHPGGDRPLSPDFWIDGLRTTAPHLFEASTGGGASGGGPSDGNAVRVRAKNDLKSAKDKSEFIAKHGYDAFAQLPLTARP